MPAADEQQLIAQAREGSHPAYRVLVDRHMKDAYNIAFSFVRDHDDAEDIVQEAFVRAHGSLPEFRGESQFGTWLYRIVVNLSLNKVKRHKAVRARELPAVSVAGLGAEVDPPPYSADLSPYIEKALHELPTLQRAVVLLRHMDGLSTREVSNILQCSEGTVKTHLFRGLRKMRKKLAFLKDDVR